MRRLPLHLAFLSIVTLAISAGLAHAQATLLVPGQHATIQAGINAASPGDTVLVAPGTYFENDINYMGKEIALRSSGGAAVTVIDANFIGRAFILENGEGPGTVLEGFTIRNGRAPNGVNGPQGTSGGNGGGMLIDGSSASIEIEFIGCVFHDNEAGQGGMSQNLPGISGKGGDGGAIWATNSTLTLRNCRLRNNSAGRGGNGQDCPVFGGCLPTNGGKGGSGGGIYTDASLSLENCAIWNNCAGGGGDGGDDTHMSPYFPEMPRDGGDGGDGGGIYGLGSCNALNSVVFGNSAGAGGLQGFASMSSGISGESGEGSALTLAGTGFATVRNSVFFANTGHFNNEISPGSASFTYSLVDAQYHDGNPGNIDADPLFVNPAIGDFHLQCASPCRDAGDPVVGGLPATDIDGDPRVLGAAVDMGVQEMHTTFDVPASFATIQSAIVDACDGDVVTVAPGTYTENIDFLGKSITVRSTAGPTQTTIDGGGMDTVVKFVSGEGAASVLEGFSITNGLGVDLGPFFINGFAGGIMCLSSPSIRNCVVTGNVGAGGPRAGGGGIGSLNASPTVSNCIIEGNTGGIGGFGGGGGVHVGGGSAVVTIIHSTITSNTGASSGGGGGINVQDGASVVVVNSIVWGNFGGFPFFNNVIQRLGGVATVTYSDVGGGFTGTGNIDADPLLDASFHLTASSPCRDAGDAAASGLPLTDIDGEARVQGCSVDMGADELDASTVILDVPASFATIQSAINAACDGNIIEVAPGTYTENIDFLGKAIMLRSTMGPAVTTIDGGSTDTVVKFVNAETPASVIEGFTITNGLGTGSSGINDFAGGIMCSIASPVIRDCIVTGNAGATISEAGGGGIGCLSSSATIENCIIEGNTGGGSAAIFFGGGGGVHVDSFAAQPVTIINSTITGNIGGEGIAQSGGGGINVQDGPSVVVINSIVWGNSSPGLAASDEILQSFGGTLTASFSDIGGGFTGTGNIDADPRFVDPAGGDFRIQICSPCIDAGGPATAGLPATTLFGGPRLVGSVVDMGADELDPVSPPIIVVPQPTQVITVSAGESIQDAIALACDGDTVEVGPGTYVGGLNFLGRDITVRSILGPAATFIDGGGLGTVVRFVNGETAAAVLEGFTISNGVGIELGPLSINGFAGGIMCSGSSPMIRSCIVTANVGGPGAKPGGGGIGCLDASPTITNCIIEGNTGGAGGSHAGGGGVHIGAVLGSSSVTILNSTITGNSGGSGNWPTDPHGGGGINVQDGGFVDCVNSIVWANSSPAGAAFESIYEKLGAIATASFSDIADAAVYPGAGNINIDPGFVDAANGDFHLSCSPCVDAGDSGAIGLPATDIDGDMRVFGSAVDMGADEHQDAVYPGSLEDFVMTTTVNGLGDPTACVKLVQAGDVVQVAFESPGGTYDGREPILLAQLFVSGLPPSDGFFPSLHVSASSGAVIIYGGSTPLFGPGVLAPGGVVLNYVMPGFIATGNSVMLQAIALTFDSTANNNFFASGNGHELRF